MATKKRKKTKTKVKAEVENKPEIKIVHKTKTETESRTDLKPKPKIKNKKKKIILVSWIAGGIVVAVILLSVTGRFFIGEIIQEVEISGEAEKTIETLEIGKKAPFWSLPSLSSSKNTLVDFFGKPIVLTFWASWNPLAVDQIKIFDEYLSGNTDQLFEIISINNQEDKSIVSNFIRRGGYEISVLLDERGIVGELYDIKNLPTTYFIDADGVVQDVFVGVLSKDMLEERVQQIIR